MDTILASTSVSISELKRNPSAVIGAADDDAVAVLVHNKPSAYLLQAKAYERLIKRLEDLESAELVRARAKEHGQITHCLHAGTDAGFRFVLPCASQMQCTRSRHENRHPATAAR